MQARGGRRRGVPVTRSKGMGSPRTPTGRTPCWWAVPLPSLLPVCRGGGAPECAKGPGPERRAPEHVALCAQGEKRRRPGGRLSGRAGLS